ncbi:MAG: hypothetical protein JNL01_14400 [Bdellovibrionales bacterium]|nr:hypothetical protein [Bdellovibrionales bacterium]
MRLSPAGIVLAAFFSSAFAHAGDQIIRPYLSIRTMGMGGTRTTLGLYEENFYGNPALVTENPKNKVQIMDTTFSINSSLILNARTALANMDDAVTIASDTSGTNIHTRAQIIPVAFYAPNRGKMSYAFGVLMGAQTDFKLRKSYIIDPQSVIDIGPLLTVGRKYGVNDELSLGATFQAPYRVSVAKIVTVLDFLQGIRLSPSTTGGDGGMVDASVGATYKIPYAYENWKLSAGASVNNLLDGGFRMYSLNLTKGSALPRPQGRSVNLGVAATRDVIGRFYKNRFAFEINDIGLNRHGSFFRWVHFGGETQYGIVKFRTGFNQGYLAAGLGLDFPAFALDFATTGEELSLNAGALQDRRYALRIGFQI